MGINWGNILTQQHLGSRPEALKEAIEQVIAPKTIEEIVPGIYWFALPFDIMRYTAATKATYDDLVQRTLAVCKPHKVLWQGGRRKDFY